MHLARRTRTQRRLDPSIDAPNADTLHRRAIDRVRENRMHDLTGGCWQGSDYGESDTMHLTGNRQD
jgi:hypothetical protein